MPSSSSSQATGRKDFNNNKSSNKNDDGDSSDGNTSNLVWWQGIFGLALCQLLYWICLEAYTIRLYAVREFGRVIHEFDPYFNYRATEYLYEHGWYKFKTWFDYLVWYPLGRPVGTTIYPGMQVTSVFIKDYILPNWSINDICVFVPAWFGVTATLSVAWLTFECTRGNTFVCGLTSLPVGRELHQYVAKPLIQLGLRLLEAATGSTWGLSPNGTAAANPLMPYTCAVAAAAIMSVVPAHLLRSVAGGYDNESIAMTAMVLTFACWTFSLRDHMSMTFTTVAGVCTGLAYFYMVAAWGGYVFVLNVVGVHATFLVLIGRYSSKLHRAYTMFYLVGTALATTIPVVGMTPLKSLEQLGPCLAFLCFQLIEGCQVMKRKKGLSTMETWKLRIAVFAGTFLFGAVFVSLLAPSGYFGPISSRVRGLFVEHTKTGNPLVDSVAEHQAASPQAYKQYLSAVVFLAPPAFVATALFHFNDSSSFLIVYACAAYYFSHKMVRLILLTAPIASVLGGICLGRVAIWMLNSLLDLGSIAQGEEVEKEIPVLIDNTSETSDASKSNKKNGKSSKKKREEIAKVEAETPGSKSHPLRSLVPVVRVGLSVYIAMNVIPYIQRFQQESHAVAKQISHPTIINKAQTQNGQVVVIDDYREAYFWLRDNTPEDARIMAWWDYGYQITGIANRTTLADGNTWNHEHIALLGRTLTAAEKDAHRIARHMADYVLVWAGGGGDDVAKSPHLRRIANSVYRGLCREPTCREFGFFSDRSPTNDMKNSLLYKLHSHNLVEGVVADRNRFREVFNSKHGKVRIYRIQSVSKESKEWVANNKVCDVEGSWFCRGQYPPALQKILKEKKDFKQLEDFNKKAEDDSDYQQAYFENLNNKKGPEDRKPIKTTSLKLPDAEIELINEEWQNNEATSMMYEIVTQNRHEELREVLKKSPQFAHIRSEDGRGPMFWAHEHGHQKVIKMLKFLGVSESRTDEKGRTPLDI